MHERVPGHGRKNNLKVEAWLAKEKKKFSLGLS